MVRTVLAGVAALASASIFSASAYGAPPSLDGEQSDYLAGEQSDYIVVLAGSVADPARVAAAQARQFRSDVGHVYRHALKGYSARMSAAAAQALRRAPGVVSVEADQVAYITEQTTPTGVQRIFADDNPDLDIDGMDDHRIDADIAILDTGIDFDHPDLNVVARTDCSFGSCQNNSGDDGHGHGTHVAGTAAAIDNNIGVVGVAPGARLHAVKVLNDSGSGSFAGIAAGIDWVVARADSIEVINMSLGCDGCTDNATSTAIENAVDAGVVVVVSAGNSDKNASTFFPANHPDVITVSALADFNGAPGGGAGATCRPDQDDTLADFSNWGSTVELAGPGVCIYSTSKNGGYATLSGTSMAAPHAAGAAAYLASRANPNNRTDVFGIRDDLIARGNLNWTDDSGDGVKEPLLDVGAPVDPGAPRASFTFSCAGNTCSFDGSGSSDPDGTITSHAWTFGDSATGSGVTVSHTYAPDQVYTVTLTVTDNSGKEASTSQQVVVGNPPPVAEFTHSCSSPTTCVFDASGSFDPGGSISTYAWTFGDGTTGTGQAITHRYPNPGGGTYTVKLTVTDNGGKTASLSKTITLPPNTLPVPVITVSSCQAQWHSCYLNGYQTRDPDGGFPTTFTYVWDFGDGTTGTGIIKFHRFPATGTYTVKLTVTDDEGTSASTTRNVTVP
ncbi:MAG: PKD domain-containing protein [Jiangellaceae bacterium]